MNEDEIRITVVTCALQANHELRRTVESIYSQQNIKCQSIVVTPDQNAKKLRWLSKSKIILQKKNGIYSAMNKGLDYVKTDYCLFLNSGDVFVKEDVLHRVYEHVRGSLWGYGSILRVYKDGEVKQYNFHPYFQSLHKYGLRYVPHPATIFHTETIKKLRGFDEEYEVSADQKLMLQFSLIQRPKVIRIATVLFNMNGISSIRSFTEIMRDFSRFRSELFDRNILDARIFSLFWKVMGILYNLRGNYL